MLRADSKLILTESMFSEIDGVVFEIGDTDTGIGFRLIGFRPSIWNGIASTYEFETANIRKTAE